MCFVTTAHNLIPIEVEDAKNRFRQLRHRYGLLPKRDSINTSNGPIRYDGRVSEVPHLGQCRVSTEAWNILPE